MDATTSIIVRRTMRYRTSARSSALTFLATLFLLSGGIRSQAQEITIGIPTIPVADSLFHLGIDRFDEGHFVEARALFQSAAEDFPLHVNTTAAMLMMSKAAFRLGDFQTARDELETMRRAYPSSRFVGDAERTIRLSDAILNQEPPDTIRIGIVLSLDPDEVADSQALFNGVRLAVEDYNLAGMTAPVKMIFGDAGNTTSGAASAVRALAAEDVDFIVGTIFSDQAIAAAEAAERERIVFMAPMATDERVSNGKRYAFQANTSIELRGRLMARFAVNGLRLHSLGVIARSEETGVSERLTDSFIQEASELGAEINLVQILPDDNAWIRLSETLPRDTLSYIEALYIPMTTEQPEAAIGALLSGLDRLNASIRILGNSAWHNLPMVSAASRYTATYSNDYYLAEDDPNLIIFQSRYGELTGELPNRLSYAGYDVTRFLLHLVTQDDGQPLYEAIWFEPEYRGLASRIGFEGLNINSALFFHRYRDGELRLIR